MLGFLIFAVVTLLFLLIAIAYLYPGSRKVSTIPGLDPSHPKDGNLADIGRAGSIHQFLRDLHADYGPIASFWMNRTFIVSVASPELFKECSHLFDRPYELFAVLEPLIGIDCIQYANGTDARKRRKMYDPPFSHQGIEHQYALFNKLAKETVTELKNVPKEEHIPLRLNMLGFAIKVIANSSFGKLYQDNNEVVKLTKAYEQCWSELERRLDGVVPPAESPRQKIFDKGKKELYSAMERAMNKRKTEKIAPGDELFIDTVMRSELPSTVKFADCLTYLIAGSHTTGTILTWCIYYLCENEDVEKKLYKEIRDVLEDEDVTPACLKSLPYLRQVLDETLRCAHVAPFAARIQDNEGMLGGHKVASGTPILAALGLVFEDEDIWPEPSQFDPDRFSEEEKKKRSPYAFKPFGFSGGRQCPGSTFSYAEASVFLITLLRKVKFELVEEQVVVPDYGLVSAPKEEIWITVKPRKNK